MKVSFLTQGMMRPTDLEMTATVCYFQFPGGRTHTVPTGKYQGGSGCRGSGISQGWRRHCGSWGEEQGGWGWAGLGLADVNNSCGRWHRHSLWWSGAWSWGNQNRRVWQTLGSSTSLLTQVYFLWPSNIPLYICVHIFCIHRTTDI